MSQLVVEMSADEAKLWQSMQGVLAQQGKMEAGFSNVAAAGRKAAAETRELERAAKRWLDSIETPLQRHNRNLQELERLLDKGKMSPGQFSIAKRQEIERYSSAGRAEQEAAAQERLLRIKRQQVAVDEDLARRAAAIYQSQQTPMERYKQRLLELDVLLHKKRIGQQQYNAELRKAGDEYHRAGAAGDKAFGAGAVSQLQNYVMGLVSIGVGVGKVTQALDDMQRKREDSAQKQAEAKFSLGSLKQVADSKGPYDYEGLKKKGEELYIAGAASSLEEGYRTVFEIKSADMMDEYELYKQLKQSRMIEQPGILAQSAQTLQTSMGKAETGDVRALVAKGLAAAEIAPGTTETVLQAASESGVAAASMGLSDEELLAALAVTAKASGSSQLAGTRMNRLLLSLQEMGAKGKKAAGGGMFGGMSGSDEALAGFAEEDGAPAFDFEGKSLMEMIRQVQEKNLDDAKLQELFGRQEGLIAYRLLLRNAEQYEQMQKRITEAGKGGPLDERLKIRDTQLDVELGASQAKASEEMTRRDQGQRYQYAEAMQNQAEAQARAEGAPEWKIWLMRQGSNVYRKIYGDEKYTDIYNEAVKGEVRRRSQASGNDEAAAKDMQEAARDLKDAAGNLREATTGGVSLGRPGEDR